MSHLQRPLSIIRFEGLFYLGLGVAALNVLLIATDSDVQTGLHPMGWRFIVSYFVVATAINLLILWLIAYRTKNIARWIFVGLVVLTIVALISDLPHALDYGAVSLALSLIQQLLCVAEIVLLFRPDAGAWFAGVRPVDPEIFR